MMKATEQTQQQIARLVRQVAEAYPATPDPTVLTDIHLRLSGEGGELVATDDDDRELARCTVDQWADYAGDDLADEATAILHRQLARMSGEIDAMGIIKPFSIVLEDEGQTVTDLYLADGDTVIIGDDLMKGLDTDLDTFFSDLMKD